MTDPQLQSSEAWIADYDTAKPSGDLRASLPSHRQVGPKVARPELNGSSNTSKAKLPRIVAPVDEQALIPEGKYRARCNDYRVGEYWGASKLILMFEILLGRHAGARLECYFNLDRNRDEDGKEVFAPRPRSSYARLMRKLFADLEEAGDGWVDPENLVGKNFRVQVKTVARNHAKEELGRGQYSKIVPNFELIED